MESPNVKNLKENLTVLEVYLQDLELASGGEDVEKISHHLALVRSKIDEIENMTFFIDDASLFEKKEVLLNKAKNVRKTTEQLLSLVRKLAGTAVAMPSTSTSSMSWTWKAVTFDGKNADWASWWDLFNTSIHLNATIENNQKMKCLTDCLKGDARLALGSLALTGSNYQAAINILKNRYADPLVLSQTYYKELEDVPVAESIRAQRTTLDKLSSIVRNLENISTKISLDNQAIIKQVLQKFPDEVLRWALHELKRAIPTLIFTPADLIGALENVIRIDDFLSTHKGTATPAAVKTVGTFAAGQKRPASASKKEKKDKKDRICVFCEKYHISADCRKFSTIATRRAQLASLKKCANCLMPHHEAKECRLTQARCGRCARDHNTAMCIVKKSEEKKANMGKPIIIVGSFLQTFICVILNNKAVEAQEIRGLLDPGSTNSYIHNDLVKKLRLPLGKNYSFECLRFLDDNSSSVTSHEVIATLVNNEKVSRTFRFLTANCIIGEMETAPPPHIVQHVLPLSLKYADYDIFQSRQRPIQILIGADLYHELVQVHKHRELPCGVHLLQSFFGWLPSGGLKEKYTNFGKNTRIQYVCASISHSISLNHEQSNSEENFPPIESQPSTLVFNPIVLERLWSLESLGIEDPNKSLKDDVVLENFRKTTYIEDTGRVNVRFPWRDYKTELPSNFRIALVRLKSLVEKTPLTTLEFGDQHFAKQLEDGIIEDAPPVTKMSHAMKKYENSRIHYLPHRWIFQKNKLRVVYDASAKSKSGHSLNDLILQGPKLTENLVQLLLNFRLFAIGLTADIEKAYLQISLNEADRDATRFLWLKDYNKPITNENLRYFRFARVPFGINASPFLLNMVLQEIFSKPPQNKWSLHGQHKFYVDNFLTSVPSTSDALQLFNTMTSRLKAVQMNLRDWATNDLTVENAIPSACRDQKPGTISILGLNWDRKIDSLSINLNEDTPSQGTKRNVLKFLASIYDPLGLVSPCILELKLFVQTCWKNKYAWNTLLPPQLNAEWSKLRNEALIIKRISVQRRYWSFNEPGEYKLHIFCDASQKAYACCAYLSYENEQTSHVASQLIFSKTRISPMKSLTIPKLELLGVLIGKRTASFLIKNLDISIKKIVLWTDATTILQWLHSSEILPPFIQNRLVEIRQSNDIHINYVPTQENPADIASRGRTAAKLQFDSLWWNGPQWLPYESLWPKPPLNIENYHTNKAIPKLGTLAIGSKKPTSIITDNIECKLLSWMSKVRTFKYIIKFCFLGSKRPFQLSDSEASRMAEKLLIIELQRKYYANEYSILKKGGHPPNNLDLFLDSEQIIRCKGRLQFARFPWEVTHPILLPRDSPATFSYIRFVHEQNAHIGTSHTLAKLRERFWIPKGRAKVRSVIHKCYQCRFWEGGSYALPPIPPLPEVRLRDVTPFLQIGIDFFGPLHVKNSAGQPVNVHVLICVCLVTRAIHLELVPDLTGEQFIMALDRECSLKRVPKLIISDNASTFTFVQPLVGVKVKITDHKVDKMLHTNNIEWYFIPQYAPWFGGAYERLNDLVKRCLKKSYGRVLLTHIELQTVLYRISDIVNSRPLTYVSAEERVEPLTPNHFLKPGPTNINLALEPTPKPMSSSTGSKLLQQWELRSRVLDAYWDAFRHLYLLSLRERHIAKHPAKKGSVPFKPEIGDVVLVQEVNMPRAYWKLGRIESLDQRQAVAHLRCNNQLIIRSIRQLYPLEVQCERPETNPTATTSLPSTQTQS